MKLKFDSFFLIFRLEPGLNSDHHYAETRRVIGLASPGDKYVIEDFETAEYEPYETLEEPYNLFRAISPRIYFLFFSH